MAQDDETGSTLKQRSVYIDESSWQQLRRLALDHGTTASSLVAAATGYFLAGAPDKVRAGIIENAQGRTPGVPPRNKQ
jgi:hypothetical protein